MSLRCTIGLHGWQRKKATLRPTRIVRRCKRCGKVAVRDQKIRLLPKPTDNA